MLEKLAKQTAVYGISTIVVRFLSYLLTPYYTRVFGQETYGVVTDIYPAAGNEDGKIDPDKLRPITFDPIHNAYRVLGEKVGNAFHDGTRLK